MRTGGGAADGAVRSRMLVYHAGRRMGLGGLMFGVASSTAIDTPERGVVSAIVSRTNLFR